MADRNVFSHIKLLVVDLDNTLANTFHLFSIRPWDLVAQWFIQQGKKDDATILRKQFGKGSFRSTISAMNISQKDRDAAEKLYRDILYTSFDWQRTGKVDDRSKSSDEDVTQRITKEAMYIPKKEFDGMIQNLTTQMETAAQTKEYERAAQLRDRIGELKEKEHEITKR